MTILKIYSTLVITADLIISVKEYSKRNDISTMIVAIAMLTPILAYILAS